MIALESEDTKQITTAIKDVIKNCIQTRGIEVETLPTFDIEFLFLNIRSKSLGEEIEVNIICPDDETTTVPVTINVDNIKVEKNDKHTNKIKLDDTLMMEMKYPSLDQLIQSNFDFTERNQLEQSFELISSCVDKIYSEEEAWDSSDVTEDEMIEFLEQMNSSQFKEIETFFETMPKLAHTVRVKNPKTKVISSVTLEGLSSFFA